MAAALEHCHYRWVGEGLGVSGGGYTLGLHHRRTGRRQAWVSLPFSAILCHSLQHRLAAFSDCVSMSPPAPCCRGICHGDVYAHNVMADEQGQTVLCDYGARVCALVCACVWVWEKGEWFWWVDRQLAGRLKWASSPKPMGAEADSPLLPLTPLLCATALCPCRRLLPLPQGRPCAL